MADQVDRQEFADRVNRFVVEFYPSADVGRLYFAADVLLYASERFLEEGDEAAREELEKWRGEASEILLQFPEFDKDAEGGTTLGMAELERRQRPGDGRGPR